MRLELGVTVWLWLVDPVIDGEGGMDAMLFFFLRGAVIMLLSYKLE